MRVPPHNHVVTALWALGATLLALAALDYLAYDFVFIDLTAFEQRLHDHIRSPREPNIRRSLLGRAALVLMSLTAVAVAGACLLPRLRRFTRVLLAVAVTATVGLTAALLVATLHLRQQLALAVEPGTGALWLAVRHLRRPPFAAHSFALACLAAMIPAIALLVLTLTRRPHTRRRTLAVAIPLTLTAVALASLWLLHGHFAAVGHEAWVTHVQVARLALIATCVLLVSGLLLREQPSLTPPRLGPPAGLLALGLAAVVATAPHRHAIDTLYPLRDPGAAPDIPLRGMANPWDPDLPPARACLPRESWTYDVTIRRDAAGQLTLRHAYDDPAPFAAGLALLIAAYRHRFPGFHEHLVLLIDRHILVAELQPLLTGLPADIKFATITVAGEFTQTVPSADGPVLVRSICAFGELQRDALHAATLAPGTTWGDLAGDPTLVRPQRPAPPSPAPSPQEDR